VDKVSFLNLNQKYIFVTKFNWFFKEFSSHLTSQDLLVLPENSTIVADVPISRQDLWNREHSSAAGRLAYEPRDCLCWF